MVNAALAAALVALASGSHSASGSSRAVADRPDDVIGPQIHFVYAVPQDGQDRALDTSGAIARSTRGFTGWLAQQTGGPTLRLDTFAGNVDVTFVRLDQTAAEVESYAAFARDRIEGELDRRGLIPRGDRVYDVYYDGPNPYACGGAPWPPQIVGQVVAMYLHGLAQAAVPCDSNAVGLGLGYWEFAMLHDTLHAFGLVAPCAPHHTRSGHVNDSPNDLMWSGDRPWVLPPVLDVGHDDYYLHDGGCPDLADSPYLTAGLKVQRLVVGSPRVRKALTARLSVELDARPPEAAGAGCAARIGRKILEDSARFSAGSASCTWRIPAGTRGKTVAGSVEVRVAGQTIKRTFARRIRGA